MSAWQSIETAPKDGRMIWLWWPYWSRTGTRGYWKHGRWVADDSMSDTDDEEPPTHWMPLPTPPAQETDPR